MNSQEIKTRIKIQSKRNVELWIYSFADMYMILSVFFIALAVIYAAKSKQQMNELMTASAGRGPASVISSLELEFDTGSVELTEKSIEEMKLLLPALHSMKNGFIDVEGYADQTGLKTGSPFSSNLDLSNRRAVRVAEWLMKNGVSPRKVRTFSYGDAHQWTRKQTPTNRRVIIKLSALVGQNG
jgi:outer membrane protein OmpA-like peptidoglycan-associated protein